MKINKFNFSIVASLLLVFACTDLDEELKGEITSDISLTGISTGGSGGGGDALTAAFVALRNAGTANHGGYFSLQALTSDEALIAAKGGDWYDGGVLIELHRHTFTASNGFINGAWNQQYSGINTVNEMLASDLDAGSKAQLRVLRAFFYWRLMDLFGNVKIITSPGQDAPQSTRAQVFDFVESEILAALGVDAITPDMDLSNSLLGTDDNKYRINRFAALGILSKVYLNAEVYANVDRYTESALAATYVIDNGGYRLSDSSVSVPNLGRRPSVASDPENLTGFAAIFAPNNENNPEIIFSVEYDEATAGGMNFSQMTLHYSSQFTWNFQDQPWNGYATLTDFYNSYSDNDARKAASFIAGPQLDFGGSAVLDYASDDGDIPLVYTPQINELEPNSLREAGARMGKYSFKQFGRPDMDNDYVIVRLGELHLNRAEALARAAGDWSAADQLGDVTAIRSRAGLGPISNITADSFLAERGREMFQETSRRTDQIRFGKFTGTWQFKNSPSDPSRTLFPIPFEQIQASGGTLQQNEGY